MWGLNCGIKDPGSSSFFYTFQSMWFPSPRLSQGLRWLLGCQTSHTCPSPEAGGRKGKKACSKGLSSGTFSMGPLTIHPSSLTIGEVGKCIHLSGYTTTCHETKVLLLRKKKRIDVGQVISDLGYSKKLTLKQKQSPSLTVDSMAWPFVLLVSTEQLTPFHCLLRWRHHLWVCV